MKLPVMSVTVFSCVSIAFYPRGASDALVIAIIVRLCVCLTICLSHAGIVSKRLNVASCKERHVIAQRL